MSLEYSPATTDAVALETTEQPISSYASTTESGVLAAHEVPVQDSPQLIHLEAQVAAVHHRGQGYIEAMRSTKDMAAFLTSAAVPNVAHVIYDHEIFIDSHSATLVDTASMAFSAPLAVATTLGAGFSLAKMQSERRQTGRLVAEIDGYGLEPIAVGDLASKAPRRQAAVVAIMRPDTEASEEYETFQRIYQVAKYSGAEHVVLPAGMVDDGEGHAAPLADVLKRLGSPTAVVPEHTQDVLYQAVPLKTGHEIDVSNETADVLELLKGKLPEVLAEATIPTNAREAKRLMSTIRPAALRYLGEQLETTIEATHDEYGIPERRKRSYFAIPGQEDDAFQPSVWAYAIDDPGATGPRKYSLGDYDKRLDVAAAKAAGGLTGQQVLSALARLAADTKDIYDKDLGQQSEPEAEPVYLSSELVLADRQLKLGGITHEENRDKRRTIMRTIGKIAAGSVLAVGVIGGASYGAVALSSNGEKSSVGLALQTGEPTWRLAGSDMDVSGKYVTELHDRLTSGLSWQRTETGMAAYSASQEMLSDDGEDPHITVEGYLASSMFKSESTYIPLPVRNGTAIHSLRLTAPEGYASPPYVVANRSDGTFALFVEGRPDTSLRLAYDLVEQTDRPTIKAQKPMTIDGVEGPMLEADSTQDLLRLEADELQDGFNYDNTDVLEKLVDNVSSPEELYRAAIAAKIANCNVAASVLAIEHTIADGNDLLAQAEGFVAEENFLSKKHAWLVTGEGAEADATPSAKGRSAAEAGDPPSDIASLQKQWDNTGRAHDAKRPINLPWDKLPIATLGAVGAVAGGLWTRSAWRSARFNRASRNLTDAQAGRVLSHAAFGDADQAPNLQDVSEILSDASLPLEVITAAAAHPRDLAPYLTRRQARGLRSHARLLLDAKAD